MEKLWALVSENVKDEAHCILILFLRGYCPIDIRWIFNLGPFTGLVGREWALEQDELYPVCSEGVV